MAGLVLDHAEYVRDRPFLGAQDVAPVVTTGRHNVSD
jgi:hypothetical protein